MSHPFRVSSNLLYLAITMQKTNEMTTLTVVLSLATGENIFMEVQC